METFPLTARLEAPCFSFAPTRPGIPGLLHPEERGSPGLGGEGGFLTPGAPAAAPVPLAQSVDVTLLGGLDSRSRGCHSPWWQQAQGCGVWGVRAVGLGGQRCWFGGSALQIWDGRVRAQRSASSLFPALSRS